MHLRYIQARSAVRWRRRSLRLARLLLEGQRLRFGLLLGHHDANRGANFGAGLPETVRQFHLHHIDAHGRQRQTEDQIQNAGHHEHRMLGHVVTEADRRHRDEHKVRGLEERPVLPQRVHGGTAQNVGEQQEDGQRNGQIEFVVNVDFRRRRCDGRLIARRATTRHGQQMRTRLGCVCCCTTFAVTAAAAELCIGGRLSGTHHHAGPPERGHLVSDIHAPEHLLHLGLLADASHRARVVQAAHVAPQHLDAAREELTKVRQQNEEHRYANDGVRNGQRSARICRRTDVPVADRRVDRAAIEHRIPERPRRRLGLLVLIEMARLDGGAQVADEREQFPVDGTLPLGQILQMNFSIINGDVLRL